MRIGLPISLLLHAGLLAWALIHLDRPEPFKPAEPEPVEVSIITEDGITRLRQGDRDSKLLEAAPAPPAPDLKAEKEPPKPTPPPPPPPQAAAPPPPPPPPPEPAKTEPPPEPKVDPIQEALAAEALALQEAQKKAAEEKKRQEHLKKLAEEKKRKEDLKKKQDEAKKLAELKKQQEAKKASQQKSDFDAEMQRALLDKAPPKPQVAGGSQQAALGKKGPVAGAPEGHDQVLTASQNAMLGKLIKDAVSRCWNINTGAEGIDKIVVKVEVNLRPDGQLAEPPRIVNSVSGPLFADTANSAVRAVVQCAPYNFPAELYKNGWDSLVWTFDPRKMF